jgi:hypothetical protein
MISHFAEIICKPRQESAHVISGYPQLHGLLRQVSANSKRKSIVSESPRRLRPRPLNSPRRTPVRSARCASLFLALGRWQFGGADSGRVPARGPGVDPHLRPQRGAQARGLGSASVVWSEDADAVLASDVDVVVELAGGLDPAGGWVRKALKPARAWSPPTRS